MEAIDSPLSTGVRRQNKVAAVGEGAHGRSARPPQGSATGSTSATRHVCYVVGGLAVLTLAVSYLAGAFDSEYKLQPSPPLSNLEARSVYFGYGCFWHAQYDFFRVERDVFHRSDSEITSLVGYAGGLYTSKDGLVCYHGGPYGSEYGDDGHAEVVQVQLDEGHEAEQFRQLVRKYFVEGFSCDGSECTRKDPQDAGPAYRNVIGLPDGMESKLYSIVEEENVHGMELLQGGADGGRGDDRDEDVVYVYNSLQFHFFRGEAYHQFHANTVLGRPVGSAYLHTLKATQEQLGRIKPTGCPENSVLGF